MASARRAQRGLSLIELLVAMFISAVVFAGVINSLLASKGAYLFDDEVAYIQENARFGLDYLAREVREAGYVGGCNTEQMKLANRLNATTDQAELFNAAPVVGYEGGVSTFPDSFKDDVQPSSDAFIIRRADNVEDMVVASHDGVSSMDLTTAAASLTIGDVMMLVDADCSQAGVFAATSVGTSIGHASGAAGSSNNCGANLGGDDACPAAGTARAYAVGSRLYKTATKAFYIAPSRTDPGSNSLYVRSLDDGGDVSSVELVSGVQDMQLQYGVNTSAGAPDGEVNQYYTASGITVAEAVGPSWVGWDRVRSVRITLVLRSRNAPLNTVTTKTMPTLATSYTDKYLYQEVSTLVNLRNVALPANAPSS